jgi:rSAM/selenodomain-associated transferase 1
MRSGERRSAWRANTPISADCPVIVFARAPLAGQVKTRLAQRIGDAAAVNLHCRLVRIAVTTARAARCGPVELHVTRRHAFFRTLDVPVHLQRGADLGERMYRALRRHRRAVLIGADCPALRAADITLAARLLAGGAHVVFAPAQDGGYALIAARRVTPAAFRGIAWGSARALAQTLEHVAGAGLAYRLLGTVWDVDRPEDLERFRSRRFSLAARRCARR